MDGESRGLLGSVQELSTSERKEKLTDALELGFDIISISFINRNKLGETHERKRSGTIMTSIFTLATGAIGAGILAFPYAIKCTGITLGVVFTLFILFMSCISYHIIAVMGLRVDAESYQDVIKRNLGPKYGFVSELALTFYQFGACTAYVTVIGDVLGPLFQYFFPGFYFSKKEVVVIIFTLLFIFPMILLKNIKFLGYTGGAAILATFYTTLFIIFYGILDLSKTDQPPKKVLPVINPSFELLSAFPLIGFAFFCAQAVPPLSAELKDPTIFKMDIIIVVGLVIVFFLEISVGVFGYLAFGDKILGNILNNFGDMGNIFAGLARLCVGFVVTFTYPIVHFTGRLTIKTLFFKRIPFNDTAYYTITVSWFVLTLLAGLFVPGLDFVMTITGSIAIVILIFLFPALLLWSYASYGYLSRTWEIISKIYAIFMALFGFFVMVSGTVIAFLKLGLGQSWARSLEWW